MSTPSPSRSYGRRTGGVLFLARLYREGRLIEFFTAQAEQQEKAEGKKTLSMLRKEYGYVGYRDELAKHRQFIHQTQYNGRRRKMAEVQKNKGRSTIEVALSALPIVAPVEQEMAWVRSHPKMTRALAAELETQEEGYRPPKPNAHDVKGTYYTPCPSRGAWNVLLAALGSPKEFFKSLLQKQRDGAVKAGGTDAETDGVVLDDMDEVERMLKAATS